MGGAAWRAGPAGHDYSDRDLGRGDLEGARSLVKELACATEGAMMRTFWVMPEGLRERGGYAFERANALLAAGRCLVLLGRAAGASVEVSSARELFAWLRAEPLLRECDDLLGEATALTS